MNHLTPWEDDIRRRLVNHQATPPVMGWEKLQARLSEQQKANGVKAPATPPAAKPSHKARFAIIATTLTAAASIALVFLLKPAGSTDLMPSAGQASPTATTTPATSPQSQAASTITKPLAAISSAPSFSSEAASLLSQVVEANKQPEAEAAIAPSLNTQAPTPIEATDSATQATQIVSTERTESNSPVDQSNKLVRPTRTQATFTPTRHRSTPHLAFALHASALQSDSKQRGGYAANELMFSAAPDLSSAPETPNDFGMIVSSNIAREVNTHVRHRTPFQLGFSVAYPLTDRWSLSTGLTYTRLSTDIESGSDASYYLTHQKLHYVGVPLQARFTALATRPLDLYITAGGMLEKCVYGEQTTTYQINQSHRSSDDDPKRVGKGLWQASLNASAGVQLNITTSIGLYFEPGLTWYAPDQSSLPNLRHDKQWQFTMQGGLRFTLGK